MEHSTYNNGERGKPLTLHALRTTLHALVAHTCQATGGGRPGAPLAGANRGAEGNSSHPGCSAIVPAGEGVPGPVARRSAPDAFVFVVLAYSSLAAADTADMVVLEGECQGTCLRLSRRPGHQPSVVFLRQPQDMDAVRPAEHPVGAERARETSLRTRGQAGFEIRGLLRASYREE